MDEPRPQRTQYGLEKNEQGGLEGTDPLDAVHQKNICEGDLKDAEEAHRGPIDRCCGRQR